MRLHNLISLLAVGASAAAVYPKGLQASNTTLNSKLPVQNAVNTTTDDMTLANSTHVLDLFACQLLLLELNANSTLVQKREASTSDTAASQAAQQIAMSLVIEDTMQPLLPESLIQKRVDSPGPAVRTTSFINDIITTPSILDVMADLGHIPVLEALAGTVASGIISEMNLGPFVSDTESIPVAGASDQNKDLSRMVKAYNLIKGASAKAVASNQAAITKSGVMLEKNKENAKGPAPDLTLADVQAIMARLQTIEVSDEDANAIQKMSKKVPGVKAALKKIRAKFLAQAKQQVEEGKIVAGQVSAAASKAKAKGKTFSVAFRSTMVSATEGVVGATLDVIKAAKSVSAATSAGAKAFSAAFKSALAQNKELSGDFKLPEIHADAEKWGAITTEAINGVNGENSNEDTNQPAKSDGTPAKSKGKSTTPQSTEEDQNPDNNGSGESGEEDENPPEGGSSNSGAVDQNPAKSGSSNSDGETGGKGTTGKRPTAPHPAGAGPKARSVERVFAA